MFFSLSKILWFFADPGNLLALGLVLSLLCLFLRWRRAAGWLLTLSAVYVLSIGYLPIGRVMIGALENRIERPKSLPPRLDGIIVLGGVVDQFLTEDREQLSVNGAVERITEAAHIAKNYPNARVVYTGGSGSLVRQDLSEANYVAPLFRELGIEQGRLVIEDQSRNTAENAAFTKMLVDPKDGQNWLLVTSAMHMPRALGSFRQAGWDVLPYPVDYRTSVDNGLSLNASLLSGMGSFSTGFREWLGLVFYRLTDRSDSFFPAHGAPGQ